MTPKTILLMGIRRSEGCFVKPWDTKTSPRFYPLPSSPTVSIRHASLRPRNTVATVGIVFVRHESEIRSIETDCLLLHLAHPCNTLPYGTAWLLIIHQTGLSRGDA